ncbi:MAG: hypothetical protein DDT37_01787 [Firmicutes bacterium]|nr:hypothetical protein [candidate division NPL-UPA2 bacterium]
MSVRSLMVRIFGDASQFEASMKKVSTRMEAVGERMSEIGGGLTTGVTLPLIALGAGAIAAATQVEGAMATIRAGTGATGKDLESLGDDFKAVFARVPENAAQVSTAIADLNTRLGLTGTPLRELSEGMLDLAGLAKVEVGPLIAQTTRVFGDWGVATADQTKTLDLLWKTSQTTGIGVDQLSAALVQFGAPLRAMNFTIEESAAMMGKWEREGVNTELVLGSLRIAMGKFAKEGVPMREGLNQTIAEIQRLGPSAEATALAMEIFGARAGPDMAAAILEGRFEFEELVKQIAASPETVKTAGEATETFAEKMAILRNQVTLAIEPIGTKLVVALMKVLPHVAALIAGVTAVVAGFGNLSPSVQSGILIFIAFIAVLGPVLSIVGSVTTALAGLTGAFTKLKTIIIAVKAKKLLVIKGVTALKSAFVKLKVVLAVVKIVFLAIAAPIGLVVAAVALLAAGVFLLVRNWSTVTAFFASLWATVREIFSTAVMSALGFVQSLWTGAVQRLTGMVEGIRGIVAGVTEAIAAPFRRAREIVGGITSKIRDSLQRINPFARSSPSLVDNVKAGVRAIQQEYGKLKDLQAQMPVVGNMHPAMAGVGAVGVAGAALGAGATYNGPLIQIQNMTVRSEADIENISRQLHRHIQTQTRARGGR